MDLIYKRFFFFSKFLFALKFFKYSATLLSPWRDIFPRFGVRSPGPVCPVRHIFAPTFEVGIGRYDVDTLFGPSPLASHAYSLRGYARCRVKGYHFVTTSAAHHHIETVSIVGYRISEGPFLRRQKNRRHRGLARRGVDVSSTS